MAQRLAVFRCKAHAQRSTERSFIPRISVAVGAGTSQIENSRVQNTFPEFLPQELCNQFEDLDCIDMLQSYKRVNLDIPGIGCVSTAYVGPALASTTDGEQVTTGENNIPIVLLHGFDGNAVEWRRVFAKLAQSRPTFALDELGSGFTDMIQFKDDESKPLGPEEMCEHLLAFLDQVVGAPVTLVGTSLGGTLAIDFATRYPQGYVDGLGFGSKAPSFISKLGFQFLRIPAVRENISKQTFYNKALATQDVIRAEALALNVPGWMEAKLAFVKSNGFIMPAEKIKKITARTLIIGGSNDEILSPELTGKFLNDIPRSEAVRIEDCGHRPQMEQPEKCCQAILDFLEHPSINVDANNSWVASHL